MRGLLLTLQQHLSIWTFSAVFIPSVIVLHLVTFGWLLRRYGRPIPRFWARTCLRLCGVRMKLSGYEHLDSGRPQVATFNHASTLDAFTAWAVMPDKGLPIIKREMLYYPILGLGMLVLDVIALDRRDKDKARASIKAAGDRMNAEGLTVVIAPEGRRSRDNTLRPFKLGFCRIAVAAKCPVVPIVIRDAWKRWPTGRAYVTPGVLEIDVLPPVPTDDWTEDNMAEKAEMLRGIYQSALGLEKPDPSADSASLTREAS